MTTFNALLNFITQNYLVLVLAFLVTYFLIIWFSDISKSSALAISFIPIFIIDWVFSLGTYTFRFPIALPGIGETYTMDKLTITFKLLDYVFNFGIWKDWGLATFDSVSGTYLLSGIERIFVFLVAYADVILLLMLISYIINSFIDDYAYSFVGGLLVVAGYVIITKPWQEYKVAEAIISHILYFMDNATMGQSLVVVLTAFLSFMIIVLLLSTVTGFFLTVGKSTIRPGLEASSWQLNMTGVSFGLAVVYSVTAITHSNYSWYVILPLLIVFSVIKSSMQDFADDRRERRQQRENIREVAESVIDLRRH